MQIHTKSIRHSGEYDIIGSYDHTGIERLKNISVAIQSMHDGDSKSYKVCWFQSLSVCVQLMLFDIPIEFFSALLQQTLLLNNPFVTL